MFLENDNKTIKSSPKFLYSGVFVWLIAILTYIFWICDLGFVGVFVLLLLSATLFCICRDTTPNIAIIVLMCFAFDDINITTLDIILVSLGVAFVVAGIIVHLFRFKPSFDFLKPNKIKGYTFAVFLILPPVALGGINLAGRNVGISALIVLMFIAMSLMYVLFYATTQNFQKEKLLEVLARLFMVMGVLICLQMLTIALKCGSLEAIKVAIGYRKFSYGWAHPNNVAIFLALSIATTLYYAAKLKKFAFLPIMLAVLEFAVMFLTTSRGAILFTAIALPFIAIFVFFKAQNRKQVGISYAVCILVVAVLAIILRDKIMQTFSRIFELGLSDNGRFEIYENAVALFKSSPVFGVGLDYGFGVWGTYQIYWFHSTAFQILACFGILGVLSFAYFFIMRYRAFLIKPSTVKIFMLAGLLLLEGYGMIDIVFFNTFAYMIMMFICLGAEKTLNDKQGLAFPKFKQIK
ncbi:MAG TPA: O-antigen ligase family protein [Clostridia bacterium]|nr:O-antigen ligase family protein [Clostridia bacterium]